MFKDIEKAVDMSKAIILGGVEAPGDDDDGMGKEEGKDVGKD